MIGWHEEDEEEEQQLVVLLCNIFINLSAYQLFFVENRFTHDHSILSEKMRRRKPIE
jgi:hypothetical protein